MNSFTVTLEEYELVQKIRNLRPFEKIEIRLNENRIGQIVYTQTSNVRVEFELT